ncbi:hypothetical protein KBZ21_40670, partial [Streptomyces sp. A73]|nr:hypothetical protein [Streptomyces sp. A73]
CARFLDDWQIQPVVVERPVASRTWWYSGTPDVIGDVPDGRRLSPAERLAATDRDARLSDIAKRTSDWDRFLVEQAVWMLGL